MLNLKIDRKLTTALLAAGIALSAAVAQARQALLSNFKGTVEVQSKGSTFWRRIQTRTFLKEGEKIRTGKNSRATLLFEDGSRTEVYPGTTLIMSQLAAPVNLQQTEGRTHNQVHKLGKGFALRTPTAVCSVRGTEFDVGVAPGGETQLDVVEGVVNGLKTATGESMDVGAGQSLSFTQDSNPLTAPQPAQGSSSDRNSDLKQMARKEVGLDMTREQIQAAAAEEMKLAEYQEGKSLIDVNGNRVRLEEYILRKPKDTPAGADPSQAFKFVVLNERTNRLDYFTYLGVFNKALPDDLSLALRNVSGRQIGSEPEFYLTQYQMTQSNVTDALKDMADGGHLVEVTFDGTNYTLKAHGVASDGKAGSVTDTVTQLASANGKVYDPVADAYKDPTSSLDGVYDSVADSFKTMKAGDTLWRTVFNRYGHLLGSSKDLASLTLDNVPSGTLSQPWYQYYTKTSGVTNIATLESLNNSGVSTNGNLSVGGNKLDLIPDQTIGNADYRYLNGHYASLAASPSGADNLNERITLYYPKSNSNIPYEQYDTFIISDEGKIAPTSAFAGSTSGLAFKQELLQWNYEQQTRSSSFQGDIDIVVEPKILIRSGLIK